MPTASFGIRIRSNTLHCSATTSAVMIFVVPPSFAELESRLRGRGTETEEKVLARIEAARGELEQVDRFDYIVVNDDLQTAVEDVKAIFRAERCRNRR